VATNVDQLAGNFPLVNRSWRVVVAPGDTASGTLGAIEAQNGIDVSALNIEFRIKKNLKAEPNTCELKICNLSSTTRRFLEQPKKLNVSVSAGYGAEPSQLYLGQVRRAYSYKDGPTFVTEMSSGDSEKEIGAARIRVSFGAKVSAATALRAIASTLGVGMGNVDSAAAKLRLRGITPFGHGRVITGSAASALTEFCRSANLEWSIQDGVLQILDVDKALENKATLLDSSSGLIGYPKIDGTGIVTGSALIQPGLMPGRKIDLESVTVKGGYRLIQCEYLGETNGQNWTVNFQAKKY